MTFDEFKSSVDLLSRSELDKVLLLAYYYHKTEGGTEFTTNDVCDWFNKLHLPRPNTSRLLKNIKSSSSFVSGKKKGFFRIHGTELDRLQVEYPGLRSGSTEVVSTDTILPREIYDGTRGFIESLAKQLNASYEYNIYDGCAVLMRRLLEVLLILSYEHHKIEAVIQDANGDYVSLSKIINDAKTNKTLKLSKDSRTVIDSFRTIGNLSAHKVYYNCRRADLERIGVHYRVTIEELLYVCGIKK